MKATKKKAKLEARISGYARLIGVDPKHADTLSKRVNGYTKPGSNK